MSLAKTLSNMGLYNIGADPDATLAAAASVLAPRDGARTVAGDAAADNCGSAEQMLKVSVELFCFFLVSVECVGGSGGCGITSKAGDAIRVVGPCVLLSRAIWREFPFDPALGFCCRRGFFSFCFGWGVIDCCFGLALTLFLNLVVFAVLCLYFRYTGR